ncbi:MAG: caspase family protein [Pseudomonadota bacterium]
MTLLVLWSNAVTANNDGPRVALVVGNADYAQIGALDNPENDASLIGSVLEVAGFEVTYLFNATQSELEAAIVELGRTLRARGPETTGLFYFAGHGVQSRGKNFLMPVDAALSDEAELDLVGVQADVVLRQMGSAKNRTNIVILDACRNNPFADVQGMDANGLAKMNPSPGTFLSYATGPGDVALDGLGQNSPFTAALAAEMQRPGQAIEKVFREVRIRVVEETRGIQTPWDTSLLTSDFVFSEEGAIPDAEALLWAEVRDTDNVRDIVRFLRNHPTGRHAADARVRLNQTIRVASAEPSRALRLQGVTPDLRERNLFLQALQSGSRQDFETYLLAFPNGVYAELVNLELEAMR